MLHVADRLSHPAAFSPHWQMGAQGFTVWLLLSRGWHWWQLLGNNMGDHWRALGMAPSFSCSTFQAPAPPVEGFSSLAQKAPHRSRQPFSLSLPRRLGLQPQAEQRAGKLLNTGNTSLIVPRPDLDPPAFVGSCSRQEHPCPCMTKLGLEVQMQCGS